MRCAYPPYQTVWINEELLAVVCYMKGASAIKQALLNAACGEVYYCPLWPKDVIKDRQYKHTPDSHPGIDILHHTTCIHAGVHENDRQAFSNT